MKTVDLVQLKTWSERLCRLAATDPLQVVAALGVGAAPAAHIRGVGRVDPPPVGTSRCELSLVNGRFRALTFTFRAPDIDRATLEDAMGPGTALRRVRPPRPSPDRDAATGPQRGPDRLPRRPAYRVAYRVVVPGAPFSCDVVAAFAEPPGGQSLATEIMLRRHRGVA